ncbi:Relaxase/Mobilisation nuclease domain-containing protein [Mariniphaga anaerophila]|uniref:Relaxase/Mobilisation nuclease domain-containing protein n=1 Tax=Mariniphaga anaerophila TaxID=1484053 RepID=A0A1M4SUU2_9BACT|nr:relaxase/mobilization nuclease domain-containing protein [Mariniphaga anaerophila]SHE35974.1 Relaxase/Mobilisation nuclease domain-containing protein [Mariniphaga anaerophila]
MPGIFTKTPPLNLFLMVIVIHQSLNTQNALFYNEKKVSQKKAFFFHSGNSPTVNPFAGSKQDRWNILKEIEERNTRVKKKCLHISVNPTVSDLVKLGDAGIRIEIKNLMEYLGYGNQPCFVYKHADLDRTHFHIVSTRIDQQTGKKIRDNYEKEKVQRFIKSLEQKYDLTKELNREQANLKFSAGSSNLKRNLESLFYQLNQIESITTKQLYDKSLELFNVEIRRSGRGYVVFVTDGNGNPVRYPIRLSEFEERPRFYVSARAEKELQIDKPVIDKFQLAQWARDLNRLIERSNRRKQEPAKKYRVKNRDRGMSR